MSLSASVGYTIIWATAHLTVVQDMITDIVYNDKPQKVIANEAGCSEFHIKEKLWEMW